MVTEGVFQPELNSNDYFSGKMTIEMTDPVNALPSNLILPLNKDWKLEVKWHVKGQFVPIVNGEWTISAYLECFGINPDGLIAKRTVTMKPPAKDEPGYPFEKYYHEEFPIGPTGTPESQAFYNVLAGSPDAAYKLVVVLTSTSGEPNKVPLVFSGYVEGPILQFYKS